MIKPKPIFQALTRYHLAAEIERWGWSIGVHTYGYPMVLEPEMARLTLGRFCSIGPHVTIALGNHRTDLVTTYPFKALAGLWPSAADGEDDHATRGDVVVGDEVWLGSNSTILSGVSIGSGAVVGAGALVSRDVPPYAIVAGNPARVLRYRFDDPTITRLLKVSWWNWPDERIAEHMALILSPDIEAFLKRAEAPDTSGTDQPPRPSKSPPRKGAGRKARVSGEA